MLTEKELKYWQSLKGRKETQQVNRILSGITKLGLALEDIILKGIDDKEQGLIRAQLKWLNQKIDEFLLR